MNFVTSGLILSLTMTLITARPDAAILGRPLLTVRTYQVTAVPSRDWNAVVRSATEILDRAGIDVDWVHCSPNASGLEALPARCTMPYRGNEVSLRIVRRPASAVRGNMPLGDSMVDASTHSGILATIYLDHVGRLARQARVSATTVMARAIAHELGHLLLGTSTHSAYGLMRPTWTPDELARNRPIDWTIPAEEGQKMQQALARRAESDLAAARTPALGD